MKSKVKMCLYRAIWSLCYVVGAFLRFLFLDCTFVLEYRRDFGNMHVEADVSTYCTNNSEKQNTSYDRLATTWLGQTADSCYVELKWYRKWLKNNLNLLQHDEAELRKLLQNLHPCTTV